MQDFDITKIGPILKNRRIEKDMSIRDLATKSGIAAGTISQIETGKTSPNLLSLKSVCVSLELPIYSLFLQNADIHKIHFVRKNEQQSFIRNISNGKPIKESLIIEGKENIWGGIVDVPSFTDSGNYSYHGGEEFVFVLKGTVKIDMENCGVYILEEYDTLSYPNTIGHRWLNDTSKDAQILIISTTPYISNH